MALKKVKKPEETENTNNINEEFNALFPICNDTSNTYNSPISYLNKNNEDDEVIEDVKKNDKLMKYESKDDATSIKRTSKSDDELKKFLKIKREERKVLTIGDYPGSVVDVSIEEVKYPKAEKYLRARISLQIVNDVPHELVPIDLVANLNLNDNSKLSRIIIGITGSDAGSEFDLNSLRGKKVSVRTKHITDKYGNINHAVDTIHKIDY